MRTFILSLFLFINNAEDLDIFFAKINKSTLNLEEKNNLFYDYLVEYSRQVDSKLHIYNDGNMEQFNKIRFEDMACFDSALVNFVSFILKNNMNLLQKSNMLNEISNLNITKCELLQQELISAVIKLNQYQFPLHENRKNRIWGVSSFSDIYDVNKGLYGILMEKLVTISTEERLNDIERKCMESSLSNQCIFVCGLKNIVNIKNIKRLEKIINTTKNIHIKYYTIKSLHIINYKLNFNLNETKSLKNEEFNNEERIQMNKYVKKILAENSTQKNYTWYSDDI
jgi:hypothetical protein